MASFDLAHPYIMKNEGGYANKKTDSGGETYKGISRKWHPTWAGWLIIDAIKKVRTIKWNEEIQDVNLKINVKNFYKKLWLRFGGDKIKDQGIATIMFDMFVMTDDDAVKIAQRLCKTAGLSVLVDGKLGPQTAAAINMLNAEEFYKNYFKAREAFHRNVAANNAETGAPNLDGWLRRLYASFSDMPKKKSLA